MSITELNNVIGAQTGDEAHVLGRFLYFSLASVLVDKGELETLCTDLGLPYTASKRLSVGDAFRSATGDIRDRRTVKWNGKQKILSIYCRDNDRTAERLCRELVKETLNAQTNRYQKLANLCYDKRDGRFEYGSISPDEEVDAAALCRRAEELFELYQRCANRRQVETICLNYLRSLEATKVTGTGHNYFVPRHTMDKVGRFEEFLDGINRLNQGENHITANSFYLIDDARQRDKMTEEFYAAVKREIEEYQERADHLIRSGCVSPSILERWVNRISNLEEKKRHYEAVLRRELDGLDDEFGNLKLLSQELSLRARGLRAKKAA